MALFGSKKKTEEVKKAKAKPVAVKKPAVVSAGRQVKKVADKAPASLGLAHV